MNHVLKCGCQNPTTDLKLEAEFFTDPIWCTICGYNLDLEDLSVSPELLENIEKWASRYGEWIDYDRDTLVTRGIELENKHNEEGQKIYKMLKNELGTKYTLIFSPSTTAKLYKHKYHYRI
ncbi:hypothetical protein [Chengkuizengella marina]|uniref:Uncharacterized protein n=1 Tax=Chengkuizengella marina TaxID=2507566 RepID=A0A6N9Q8Y0_9BACL|nr:hypothetical protein [Chengkuizengella marina]NBI31054.1 hypothetical protein [Chengkuizengella marina]